MKVGSGRASIESPAAITVKDGVATASIVWSSPNYDYMIVDGKKLFPVNTEGNSVFEIPVASFDTELDVIADTVAMSKPHEIEYTLAFDFFYNQDGRVMRRESLLVGCALIGTLTLFSRCRTAQKVMRSKSDKNRVKCDGSASENKTSKPRMC